MRRYPASRLLPVSLLLAATMLAGCDGWPFRDRGEPAPQQTAAPRPSPPRQPSPTILIPPPID